MIEKRVCPAYVPFNAAQTTIAKDDFTLLRVYYYRNDK